MVIDCNGTIHYLLDEVYLTSVSWVIPNTCTPDVSPAGSPATPLIHVSPNINTCRPMSFQDEGAKVEAFIYMYMCIHYCATIDIVCGSC